MQVVENTQYKLVMENRPAKLSLGLAMGWLFIVCATIGVLIDPSISWAVFALACSLIVLVPFFLFRAERTRLTLDILDNKMLFERKTLFGWQGEDHPLSDVHCAEIEKQTDRDGTRYRPVVGFKAHSKIDQIAMVQLFAAPKQAQEAVDAVNKWLERNRYLSRKVG